MDTMYTAVSRYVFVVHLFWRPAGLGTEPGLQYDGHLQGSQVVEGTGVNGADVVAVQHEHLQFPK